MATLTYDSTEQTEGELSAEAQESLEVGEKLAEQQEQLLAGKFKNAEDLEKSYIELQKKLGEEKQEAEPEVKEEPKAEEKSDKEKVEEVDTTFLDTLWNEANDKYTDDTLKKLDQLDAREIAQMHLKYRAENQPQQTELSKENVKDFSTIEQEPKMLGRQLVMLLNPLN